MCNLVVKRKEKSTRKGNETLFAFHPYACDSHTKFFSVYVRAVFLFDVRFQRIMKNIRFTFSFKVATKIQDNSNDLTLMISYSLNRQYSQASLCCQQTHHNVYNEEIFKSSHLCCGFSANLLWPKCLRKFSPQKQNRKKLFTATLRNCIIFLTGLPLFSYIDDMRSLTIFSCSSHIFQHKCFV